MTRGPGVPTAPMGPAREDGPSASGNHVRGGRRLPEPGDLVGGKYLLVRVIGQGGMAVVFEATHPRLQQRLAIKVLRPDVQDFEDVMARFEREARATSRLRSAHTARVVDVDALPNGLPYIVMEFLDGEDLDAALHASGAMPVERAVDVVLQVAEAMEEAHGLGIVHRDLKPANIFVCKADPRPVVKVLDYGVSKNQDDQGSRITQADAYFGTPCYASPEQLRSAGEADARSDVWSLGIILFELVTGRTPFVGSTTSVIAKVMADPIPSPIDLRPDLPVDLARIVLRALERDPAKRFQSMGAFAEALEPFGPADKLPSHAPGPRGRLGELLIAGGFLTEQSLKRALDEQRTSGKLLGRVLLDMGLVAHADLLAAVAMQQGIEVLHSTRRAQGALAGPAVPSDAEGREQSRPARPVRPTRSGGAAVLIWVAVGLALVGALGVGSVYWSSSHGSNSSATPR
jgi:serine/threonine protein kinase